MNAASPRKAAINNVWMLTREYDGLAGAGGVKDVARQLAEQRIELAGQQLPIPFTTTIDRDLIGKKARITVSARIEHQGKPLFVSDKIYPALINGQPQPQEINLRPARRGKKT